MKNLIFSIVAGACLTSLAIDLSGYKQLNQGMSSDNHVRDPSFDDPLFRRPGLKWDEQAWHISSSECVISADHGFSQRGLGIVRSNTNAYTVQFQQIRTLKPNTRYVCGFKVRVTDAKYQERASACFGLEGDTTPIYKTLRGNTKGWEDFSQEFSTGPKTNGTYTVCLFVTKGNGNTCVASYDDFYVREAGGEYRVGVLNPYGRVDGDWDKLVCGANTIGSVKYPGQEKADLAAVVEVRSKSEKGKGSRATFVAPIRNDRFEVDMKDAKLADGEYDARVLVIDRANKLILGKEKDLRVEIGLPWKTKKKPPRGAVTIDKYGRTLVDGKPFMPIGLYTGGITSFWEQEYFKTSPFNTLLCYHSFFYRLGVSKKRGTEGLRELMDVMDANGMKLLISSSTFFPKFDRWLPGIKKEYGDSWSNSTHEAFLEMAANGVKDHPALLGYYITDELPPERYKELVARRALFNRIDPYHPTTGVYFKLGEIAAYTGTQDAPSIDFYPITGLGPQNQSLIDDSMIAANKTWTHPETGAMPFWATLQLFSWGDGGNNPDKNKTYRMPTEHEQRAMALLSAIGGAKGFIYYYFHDICYGTYTKREDWMPRFLENWRTISRALETVKELEPFILSTTPAPKVTVKNVKGVVRARAFVDDEYGRIRVLVSALGPGESEAEITVEGENALHTQFGRTKHVGDAKSCTYLFKGTDVDCDVLQRWTERELEKDLALGKTKLAAPDAEHARATRRHAGIPAIAASPKNGRLWATWYASPTPSEDSNSYAILATSGGDGKTWKEVLIADPDGKGPRRAFDSQVFVGPDGRLRWFWAERKVPVRTSDANGWQGGVGEGTELWAVELDAENEPGAVPEPVRVGDGGMVCKPTVLRDGTWLLPCAHYGRRDGAFFLASKDGTSFVERGSIRPGAFDRGGLLCEQQTVELKDGRLWCWLRVDGGFGVGESYSSDGGRTWTPAATNAFVHTPTRTWLSRLKSGNLILVKHGKAIDKDVKRTHLTALLSRDDGRTWEGGLELDARTDAAYPDGVQLADGSILVVYDHDRLGKGEILTARFTEADVLAGKAVSGKVALKEGIR